MFSTIIIIYSSLLSFCNRLGHERPTPHLFFLTPFRHTSGIIFADPIYRLVAGGKPTLGQTLLDISPRGDIQKNRCPR
jgi:hypothetical protein